ncbi:hypothetical protein [Saccharopolyspora sp. 5N708]|uniref:hypothetical protein n=1 Tax=Saccharopolyspora sp. 5N708 TaxID=3457424 RepID=UPI003FD4FB85
MNPARQPHLHNWIVLLDNVDHGGGFRFIEDITAARERHLRQHEEHDPLLIIATSGRWHPDWESDWHPPWKSVESKPDDVSVVPRCRNVGHWRTNPAERWPTATYLPVLLEPLKIEETARILRTSVRSPEARLAQRASGGLPQAVHTIKDLLDGGPLNKQRRDTLWPDDPAKARSWRERLDDLRLSHHLLDVDIEEFVTVAAWATAPWLVPAESTSLVSQADADWTWGCLHYHARRLPRYAPGRGGAATRSSRRCWCSQWWPGDWRGGGRGSAPARVCRTRTGSALG